MDLKVCLSAQMVGAEDRVIESSVLIPHVDILMTRSEITDRYLAPMLAGLVNTLVDTWGVVAEDENTEGWD
jgi:hypothetical protein